MEIEKNIDLSQYTTFKIGGRAKYFCIARNQKELIDAVGFAKRKRLPFSVIGNGSNVLISDKGYKGLIIKMQNQDVGLLKPTLVKADAGVMLGKLLNFSLENSLTGLEWVAGIPGTAGGAVFGNAGALGQSIKDSLTEVDVLDTNNLKIKTIKNKDLKFGYRDSILKKKKNLIVFSCSFRLRKGEKEKIRAKIRKNLKERKERQPLFPSAGSVFKNPIGFSAGELIEKAGLKGKRIGGAEISLKHANFIINVGRAKEKDVKKLINFVKKQVKNKFGLVLEEEIQFF